MLGPLVRKVDAEQRDPTLLQLRMWRLARVMMTTVASPTTNRGSWFGVFLTPRVTISRRCAPSCMCVPLQCLEDGHLDALAAQGYWERNGGRALEETIEMEPPG